MQLNTIQDCVQDLSVRGSPKLTTSSYMKYSFQRQTYTVDAWSAEYLPALLRFRGGVSRYLTSSPARLAENLMCKIKSVRRAVAVFLHGCKAMISCIYV